jgi:hypothetical protein
MRSPRARLGLCWFAATCLAIIALLLVLGGVVASAGSQWSPSGVALLTLAGVALVIMGVLMAYASGVDRRNE